MNPSCRTMNPEPSLWIGSRFRGPRRGALSSCGWLKNKSSSVEVSGPSFFFVPLRLLCEFFPGRAATPLTHLLTTLTFPSTTSKMLTLTQGKKDGKEFVSSTPGYWPGTPPELWNDWKWQLKNRVTSLTQLEQHLELSNEERNGVLLSGDKLALAVTPHFFNLIPRTRDGGTEDPTRRQVMPRTEGTWTWPCDMRDRSV